MLSKFVSRVAQVVHCKLFCWRTFGSSHCTEHVIGRWHEMPSIVDYEGKHDQALRGLAASTLAP